MPRRISCNRLDEIVGMSLDNVSNIFLIGPMGAGKSSVGVRLAKLFRMPFFDTDREVELRSGVAAERRAVS